MAVANTLEQMKREHGADIEQTRSYSVSPDLLEEEEGFNVRDYSDPETERHINQLAEAYKSGSWVPPLLVKTVDGKLLIRDGHCRNRAIQKARDEGTDIRRIDVIEYQGDDVDQITLLLTSNAGKDLKPLERAAVYQRLSNHGLTDDEIAKRVQHTPQHVRQMLALTSLPTAIKDQIDRGIIAPTFAMELYQEHGKKAAKIIEKAYQGMMAKIAPEKKEKDGAKMKVTRKHVTKQRRLPPAVLSSLRGTMSNLAPLLASVEIDDNQDTVSFSVDRELFMKLREDAEKVKKANDKAVAEEEAEAKALEADQSASDSADESLAQDAEAAPATDLEESPAEVASAASENEATQEEPAEELAADSAEVTQEEEEPLLHQPAAAAAQQEEEEDFNLSESSNMLGDLARLKGMTSQSSELDEDVDGYTIVRDEEEEALGMHNTPDY